MNEISNLHADSEQRIAEFRFLEKKISDPICVNACLAAASDPTSKGYKLYHAICAECGTDKLTDEDIRVVTEGFKQHPEALVNDGIQSEREAQLLSAIRDSKDPAKAMCVAVEAISATLASNKVRARVVELFSEMDEAGKEELIAYAKMLASTKDARSSNVQMRTFQYEGEAVREVEQNGEHWWVLADVCKVLGLSNPRVVAERLDDDERRKLDLRRQGSSWAVNESGLYSVILRSDKPEAKKFKRWVTHEVLPAIRKTGGYGADLTAARERWEAEAKLKQQYLKAECYDMLRAAYLEGRGPMVI